MRIYIFIVIIHTFGSKNPLNFRSNAYTQKCIFNSNHIYYSKICGHIKENYDRNSRICLVLKET